MLAGEGHATQLCCHFTFTNLRLSRRVRTFFHFEKKLRFVIQRLTRPQNETTLFPPLPQFPLQHQNFGNVEFRKPE